MHTPLDVVLPLALEETLDRLLGFGRSYDLQPFGLGTRIVGRDDLDLVATVDLRGDRFELVVDLGADGAVSDLRVDVVCEIERRGAERHFRASPLGVNTTISEVYSDNLKLSRKSTAFSVGLFSAERICLSHLSNSSSSCEMVACLYFQCAANPLSAMSSMRWVRICTSTHTPSGPITVECSAS